MKKQLLLPFLLLALAMSSCDLLDDRFELPTPDNRNPDVAVVREKIQGEWLNYKSVTYNGIDSSTLETPSNRTFTFAGDSLVVLGMDDNYYRYTYMLEERDDKTYILPNPRIIYIGDYAVTSITDSTMEWTVEATYYPPAEPFDPRNPTPGDIGYPYISTQKFRRVR